MSKNPENSRDREFTVILEDLRSKFEVFGEGLQDVREHVGRVEKTVEEMKAVMVTKDELRFVVSQLATKEELQRIAARMATKDALQQVASQQIATRKSLNRFFNTLSDHEHRIHTLEKTSR